jgi:hypothetical protein
MVGFGPKMSKACDERGNGQFQLGTKGETKVKQPVRQVSGKQMGMEMENKPQVCRCI